MKAKIFLLFITFLIAHTSCNKLLDVKPETFTSGSNYYQTEQQISTAVNGAYATLQGLNMEGYFWIFTEVRSDNSTYQYNPNNRCCITREQVDEFLNTPTDRYTEIMWSMLYTGVQQANVILGRINDVPFSSDAKKQQFTGEAKFIRALLYFNLVRLFGEIPLRIEEVKGPSDAFTEKKAKVEEVYTQIIKDATEAVTDLPTGYSGADVGRATKAAAQTLLGHVHLTRKEFPEAVTALQQVADMNYALLTEYADVFAPTHKNSMESIFEIQYNASIEGENSNFFYNFGPFPSSVELTGFQGQLEGLNIPTPSIINAYEAGDKRRDASIGYYVNAENSNAFESFPGDSIPFVKKFYHPPFQVNGRTNENWPVYRYSHVLLMLAEALNEADRTGDAFAPLNRVRQRAGLGNIAGLSKDDFRIAVYKEQRVELAFENHRWFDLVRTGQAIQVMRAHGAEEKIRLARVGNESFNVQEYMLVYPIPASEIRLNGFEQNPHY